MSIKKPTNWAAVTERNRRLSAERELAEAIDVIAGLQNELNSVRTRAGLPNRPYENYEHFRSYISRLETELRVTKEAFLSRPKPPDIDALEFKIDELKTLLARAEIDAWRWRRVTAMISVPQIVGWVDGDRIDPIHHSWPPGPGYLPVYEWRFRAVGEKDFEKGIDKSIDKSKKDSPHAFNRKILD